MIAAALLSTDIFPLKKTDTVDSALVFMHDWKVFHLPVVDNGLLIGYISFDDIVEVSPKQKIEKYIVPNATFYVHQTQHLFEVIGQFANTKYTCIAVCNSNNEYLGAIGSMDIYNAYLNSSLAQAGAIIVLRMNATDFSLAELSRIIEYNDCKIINVFVNADKESESKILVSLKLNKQSVTNVVQTLERYQYDIHALHQLQDQNPELNARYDWLIKYLNT